MAATTTHQTRYSPEGSLTRRFADVLQRAWTVYWTDRAERATAQVLHSLDDRTLKDIGLDRSEIESVAHNLGRERRIDVRTRSIPQGRHLSMRS
jgi:uncharacterized protein YjiS (DUF1127 family)